MLCSVLWTISQSVSPSLRVVFAVVTGVLIVVSGRDVVDGVSPSVVPFEKCDCIAAVTVRLLVPEVVLKGRAKPAP